MAGPARSPAVLVMADAPVAGAVLEPFEALLGPDGCARLAAALLRNAIGWGAMVAPARVWVAVRPASAQDDARAVTGMAARLLGQRGDDPGERLAAATADVFAEHDGPLLVVGTGVPTLQRHHADAALSDLDAGCDVSFGRSADGGYYLVALAASHPEVFALRGDAWRDENVLMATMGLAHEAGLSMGMLRLETALETPADARLLALDPHLPREIRGLLAPALG
jgi:uncharacterized protein